MPSREARAQLEASGLGCHVAVKRAGMEGREAYWSAAARDCGKARGKNHSRERDNGTPCMCAPGVRAGHHGGTQLSGLDGCQWIPCARAVRSARAAIAPTHVARRATEPRHARSAKRRASKEARTECEWAVNNRPPIPAASSFMKIDLQGSTPVRARSAVSLEVSRLFVLRPRRGAGPAPRRAEEPEVPARRRRRRFGGAARLRMRRLRYHTVLSLFGS